MLKKYLKKIAIGVMLLVVVFGTIEAYATDENIAVSTSGGKYTITLDLNNFEGIPDVANISSVLFPTWTTANGQDDLVWAEGTISGTSVTYTVDYKDHNYEAGEYTTHVYVQGKYGTMYNIGSTACIITDSAPAISNVSVSKQDTSYTITANVTDDYSLTKVCFATWTESGGQDDLIWGEGTISGNTVTYTVDARNHNSEDGTYVTHIYAYDNQGQTAFVEVEDQTLINQSPVFGDCNISSSEGKYTITVNVSDGSGIDKVLFPTWTESGGQDDLIWGEGTVSGNTATFTVDFKDHNYEEGSYITHIYAWDTTGRQSILVLDNQTIYNESPVFGDYSISSSEGTYTVTVNVSDGYGLEKVLFPTWTESGDQDDLIWGEGTISGNTATYTVDYKDHNYEEGGYITHIYAWDAAGKQSVLVLDNQVIADDTAPVIGDYSISSVGGMYTITVDVSDNYDVSKVLFPTWSESGGQDDLVWGEGTISGNTVTYTVDFKDHNYEEGTYITHIYAWDASGNQTVLVLDGQSVVDSAPIISNIQTTSFDGGYTVTATVTDDRNLTTVRFATWSTSNGQDDIVWSKGTISGNTVTYKVDYANHDYEAGDYTTHIYAYDDTGHISFATVGTVEIEKLSGGWYYKNTVKYLNDSSGTVVSGAKKLVIDVSHWQEDVNWTTVFSQTDVDAVIVRSSYGFTLEDREFADNIAALEKLGASYGIYHYSTAETVAEAKEQANFAVSVMKAAGADPDLPVYVDIEEDGGSANLASIAVAYCQIFEANGYTAGIYASESYWNNYLTSSKLDSYVKWIAKYGSNDGLPTSGWRPDDEYSMWQYTSVGSISGISGNVDMNVMF